MLDTESNNCLYFRTMTLVSSTAVEVEAIPVGETGQELTTINISTNSILIRGILKAVCRHCLETRACPLPVEQSDHFLCKFSYLVEFEHNPVTLRLLKRTFFVKIPHHFLCYQVCSKSKLDLVEFVQKSVTSTGGFDPSPVFQPVPAPVELQQFNNNGANNPPSSSSSAANQHHRNHSKPHRPGKLMTSTHCYTNFL